jgi:hypothetical protein
MKRRKNVGHDGGLGSRQWASSYELFSAGIDGEVQSFQTSRPQ